METGYFSLEVNKSNKVTRIFQLVFGIVCAVVAVIWLIINFNSLTSDWSLVITIIFLLGFAYYQINSGLGRGEKFVEISQTRLKLKKNSLLPAQVINASDIERIEVFPLSIVITLRSGEKRILRFGTTFTDIIDPVKRGIGTFCSENNISLEFKNEEI